MATGIVLVHERVAGEFTQKLVQKARGLRVGNAAGRDVQLDPIINERQRDRVHQIVQSRIGKGCQLLAGGKFDRSTCVGNCSSWQYSRCFTPRR